MILQDEMSQECLNLWASRKILEVNANLCDQLSTDLSTDQSASTSFESNTEPLYERPLIPLNNHSFLELPSSAELKRRKYK